MPVTVGCSLGLKSIFVLEWMLATTVALVLALLVSDILFALLGWYLIIFIVVSLFLLPGGLFGLMVGTFQWLVLRQYLPQGGSWILATSAGFAGAGALLFVGVYYLARFDICGTPHSFACFLVYAGVSPLVGFAQWIPMRRWTSRAAVWVLGSILGWTGFLIVEVFKSNSLPGLNGLVNSLVDVISGYDSAASPYGATLLGGLLAGGITGSALLWVLGDRFSRSGGKPLGDS